MTSALVRFTDGPDTAEHAERAADMIKKLKTVTSGAATMLGSTPADLTPVLTLAGAADDLNTIVKEQRSWYSLYVTGPSKELRDTLKALAAGLRAQSGRPGAAGKLALLLTEQASVCEQHVETLTKAAAVYDIAAGGAVAPAMPDWLATHLPGEKALEAYLVLSRMGAERAKHQFATYLARVKSERKESKIAVDDVAADVEARLAKSNVLKGYNGSIEGLIAGHLTVLGDEAFIAAYVENFLTVNAKVISKFPTSARVLPVSEVDNVEGFHEAGKVVIRPETDLSGRIHEALHALSHKLTGAAWHARFGMPMEEAACEYITRLVCKEQTITVSGDGYYNNVALLERIISAASLSPTQILAGYLGGDVEPVAKAIVKASGEKGLRVLTSSQERMCYQTYYEWVEQYDATQSCIVS